MRKYLLAVLFVLLCGVCSAEEYHPEVIDEPEDNVPLDPKLQAEIEAYWIVQRTMYREVAEKAELTEQELATVGLGGFLDNWDAGIAYAAGKRLFHDGVTYIVVQAHTSQAHQPPGETGMLAVYRPVDGAAGTAADPKTFIVGMDVANGVYYRYGDGLWLAKADMKPCAWPPGTVGLWQWEKME